MTIHLPDDLERFLRSEVRCGHFASEQDAVEEAVRLLQLRARQAPKTLSATGSPVPAGRTDPLLGVMRDAAHEMDEIVADALKQREQQPWRLSSSE